jgi:exosortase/archaeosortase family protein
VRSKITIFLIKIFVLFALWFILNELLRTTRFWQIINSIVLREVLFLSKYTLIGLGKLLNITIQSIPSNGIKGAPHDTLIYYAGEIGYTNYKQMFISNRCLALDLMYTFSVFIIAFFGPWRKKILFIILGILVINLLNVLRVIGLVMTSIYFPQYLDFNHHLLFTYIVYFFTFIMWVIWIRRYAKDDIIRIIEDMKEKESKKK